MEIQSPIVDVPKPSVAIRLLQEADINAADRVMRLAFGTFLGMPEPLNFMGDADYVRTRWRSSPDSFFCATVNAELIGSNFAANWGSVGFFGPLTTHPKFWGKGIAKLLMEPVMQCFEKWETKNAGLFTFSSSQKHIALYQKFGFWPRFLTALMSKTIEPVLKEIAVTKFSELSEKERQQALKDCREVTHSIYEGLDVSLEINSVFNQNLGDTVLLYNEKLEGFAVCHCGPGTEAGKGTCYIKFAAVRSDANASENFICLLKACENVAAQKQVLRLSAGMNAARQEAYNLFLNYGFKTDRIGVAMQRPNEAGYNRQGVYLIDDWR